MLVYVALAGALTIAGLFIEYLSLQQLGAGELVPALWLAAAGVILLYAGLYGVGYQRVASQFR